MLDVDLIVLKKVVVYVLPTFHRHFEKVTAKLRLFSQLRCGPSGRGDLVPLEVYLARESKKKCRTSHSASEPNYNLLDSDTLENQKDLLLRKMLK